MGGPIIDTRDPEKLGMALLNSHEAYRMEGGKRRSLSATYDANKKQLEAVDPYDVRNIGPVEKYGKPGELVQLTEAVGPTFETRR